MLALKMRRVFALLATSMMTVSAWASVPTPKEILGHDIGEDYYLANYEESVAYFKKLAETSDRIKLFTAGKTTEGRTFVYAVVSSPENLAQYAHYVDISKRLAAVKGLDDAAAKALAQEGKVIVHIDGGMHSTEVSTHQSEIQLAYKLVGSQNDPEVDAVLKNTIVILWPTLNPDGMDMVVDWYRKNRGTQYETSTVPWLYQEYVGHDNNRDGYMLNMIESQNIFKAEQEYSPEIWYSHHQTAPYPARIWVPPFSDPVSSNISSYMRMWTTTIGINMMDAFEQYQMPGAIARSRFDNWYAGFLDYTHVFRNTMSFFTEVGHASATPKFYDPKKFPKDFRDGKATIDYPSPWKGGWWHFADSIRYDMVASMSVLDTAVRYREVLLYNRYQAGRDMIRKYESGGPYAYVIPSGQKDAPEAALLAQKLIDQGLTVHRATQPVMLAGTTYPEGSWVVLMNQPFAGLVSELFEPQKYPDAILDGGGKPVDVPYDVTGWTLPMQFGVTAVAVKEKPTETALAALSPVTRASVNGGIAGTGETFVLSRSTNASYVAANAAAKAGANIGFAKDVTSTSNGSEAGAIVVTGIGRAELEPILIANSATAAATSSAPAVTQVKPARVGLYRPWGSNIDEGWTRWLLEKYGYAPVSLRNADMQGDLSAKFDTIILPDMRGLKALMEGLSPNSVPLQYSGGIGGVGAAALKKFVAEGGTLVALNQASNAAIDLLELPVTDIVKGLKSEQFFCSGALVQIKLGAPTQATAGMPSDPIVMFDRGPVFETKKGFKGSIIASYQTGGSPLRSGVMLHPEKIEGKGAAVEVDYGKGHVYLYGFRPQWRGQSHGSYKMLFNLLYAEEKPAGGTAH